MTDTAVSTHTLHSLPSLPTSPPFKQCPEGPALGPFLFSPHTATPHMEPQGAPRERWLYPSTISLTRTHTHTIAHLLLTHKVTSQALSISSASAHDNRTGVSFLSRGPISDLSENILSKEIGRSWARGQGPGKGEDHTPARSHGHHGLDHKELSWWPEVGKQGLGQCWLGWDRAGRGRSQHVRSI